MINHRYAESSIERSFAKRRIIFRPDIGDPQAGKNRPKSASYRQRR